LASRRGRLIVIAGPSGVGKGSLVKELLQRDPTLALSTSVTTRPPRAAEREGEDYFFVSTGRFEQMVDAGQLLEWAPVFDHYYGTPADAVEAQLAAGRDVILEIDVQGAKQIRERLPDALMILLAPPSIEELTKRLRRRGTESEDKIERRMADAVHELAERDRFDRVVVNDDLQQASSQVAAIIEASR
jgi:guanylate kinase